MTYGQRLESAMAAAGLDRNSLARRLGISVAAVGLVINGKTKMFDAANHSAACEIFGCRPTWLATGQGLMLASEPIPAASTPPRAPVTIAGTLGQLGELLAAADPKTRDMVAQLLMRYAQDPADGSRIAQAIELLLRESPSSDAAAG